MKIVLTSCTIKWVHSLTNGVDGVSLTALRTKYPTYLRADVQTGTRLSVYWVVRLTQLSIEIWGKQLGLS